MVNQETFPVQVNAVIQAPAEDVFRSIYNPDIMSCYFISRSTGSMDEGADLVWYFDDFDVSCEVKVLCCTPNERISFQWNAIGKKPTTVDIHIKPQSPTETKLEITESEFDYSAERVKKALGQTQGWTDFICSLRAYLYTGVNLRTGRMNRQETN